ncbi:MAG TPA: TlpA disulfide reductase family protein [Gemmatimonadales bacterium]|nr:TlpA disulfide reductase family protein [Gemmatimonadales bacterium]
MRRTLGAWPAGLASLAILAGCRPAPSGFTLLFLGRSPVARAGALSWAPDAARSRLVAFDGKLRVVRTIADPRLATPMAVASLHGRLLVTERTGEGVVFDTAAPGTPVREWDSPFPASLYATGDDRIVAARSPYLVQFVAEDGNQPLLWLLDTLGRPSHGVGAIHVPDVAYLAQLTNAGPVALGQDGAIYFAPLVRDEILKLDPTGAILWRTQRGLFRQESDPHFLPSKGRDIRVAHALVNIALALGPPPSPDGRLYVLGAEDSAALHLRLDVLDPASGRIVTTRVLGTAATAIAVDRRGTLRILDPDSLLASAAPPPRPRQMGTSGRAPFGPPFALPTLSGDTLRLDDFRGRVTLVNFWASWCDPCREEFPHMAALYREFARKDFAIAAISDDVDGGKMRAFVAQFRPPFPILVGAGRMKAAYHYRGLPYSVLLDREGRIIERIFGFGGAPEFRALHETIAKEIRAP